jgi:hypothetical protein
MDNLQFWECHALKYPTVVSEPHLFRVCNIDLNVHEPIVDAKSFTGGTGWVVVPDADRLGLSDGYPWGKGPDSTDRHRDTSS